MIYVHISYVGVRKVPIGEEIFRSISSLPLLIQTGLLSTEKELMIIFTDDGSDMRMACCLRRRMETDLRD